MICDNCKRFFTAGHRPDGIPNGIKMVLEGNKSITMCADCVINIGKMTEEKRSEFFDSIKNNKAQ